MKPCLYFATFAKYDKRFRHFLDGFFLSASKASIYPLFVLGFPFTLDENPHHSSRLAGSTASEIAGSRQ